MPADVLEVVGEFLVEVLGRLVVTRAGGATELDPSTNIGVLLGVLSSRCNERVGVDELAAAVWPAGRPVSYRKGLQVAIVRLRDLLDPGRAPGDVRSSPILGHTDAYELRCPLASIDAERFELLVREGGRALSTARPAEAADLFRRALALWGEPFAGVDVPALGTYVERMHLTRRAAITGLLEADVQLGREDLVELERAVEDDPFDERRWGHLMVGLYRRGRQADSLATFQRARRVLIDEIGVEPGPYLRSIEEQVLLQHGPALVPLASPRPAVEVVDTSWPAAPHRAGPVLLRADELRTVESQLERWRVVTVVGPPGVGKTTLATAIASARDRSSVAWASLRAVRNGPAALIDVAQILGVVTESGARPAEFVRLLATRIGDRPLLLVLDNAEHVVEPLATLVDELIRTCPNLVVLATSRRPLGLRLEQVTHLAPFRTDDGEGAGHEVRSTASAYVQERIGIELREPEQIEALDRLCTHVGGLALGLEQVASRLRSITPVELVDRLAMVHESEQTDDLATAIGWSISLCTPDELRLLRGLACLEGPWHLARAEALGARLGLTAPVTARVVTALVEQSLITDAGGDDTTPPRRRLIEPVRYFVHFDTERTGDASPYEAACADVIVQEVREAARLLEGVDQRRGITWLHELMPDIRRTVHWGAANGRAELVATTLAALRAWWWASGLYADGQLLHDVADPVIDAWTPDDREARFLRLRARAVRVQARPGFASPAVHAVALAQHLAEADRLGAPAPDTSWLAQQLACGLTFGNERVEEAALLAERSLDDARVAGDLWLSGWAFYALAITRGRNDAAIALDNLERSISAFTNAGDLLNAARITMFLGHGIRIFGEGRSSERAFEQAERWCTELGAAPVTQLDCALGRAQGVDAAGDRAAAAAAFRELAPRLWALGDYRCAAVAQRCLAALLAADGDLEGGSVLVLRALETLRALDGEDSEMAACFLLRGEIAMAREQHDLAARLLGRAAQLSNGSGVPMEIRDFARIDGLREDLTARIGAERVATLETAGREDRYL